MSTNTPRTLAELSPEKQQACIGMWCEITDPEYTHDPLPPMIINRIDHVNGTVVVISPREPRFYFFAPAHITLLGLDQLRAWNPDGTPVDTYLEQYTTEDDGRIYPQPSEHTSYPPGTPVLRWVTDAVPTSPLLDH